MSKCVTLSLLAACGGSAASSDPSGAVTGSAYGTTFNVASVYAFSFGGVDNNCTVVDGGPPQCSPGSVQVWLTNRTDDTCSFLQSVSASETEIAEFANQDVLVLNPANPNGELTPGTYEVVPRTATNSTTATTATLLTTTSTCKEDINQSATGGTITLTVATSAELKGTYDVTFGSQGSFSGRFDVAVCDIPATAVPPVPPKTVCL